MIEEVSSAARSKARVCHFSSVHRLNDIRVYVKECRTLADAGYDVTLIAVDAEAPDTNVRTIPLSSKGNRLTRMVRRAWRAYSIAKQQRADIYHFHDPELLPYALWLKRGTKARVIYDSHECYREDIQTKEWLPAVTRKPVGAAVGTIENFVVGRLDAVVAATPHIAEAFRGIARRVTTINNYPLKAEFDRGGAADEPTQKDAVTYVGAISFARGIIPLLDAFDHVPAGVRFDLAGLFASKAVEDAVRAHRNWHRVTFHGQIGRSAVAKLYAKSLAGIVTFLPAPNHIYSQPNKLFEYMSAGIPVICSNFALWRDVVEGGHCGIAVDPNSPPDIAAAINRLVADAGQRKAMVTNGKELVENTYNWEREGPGLVALYDDLIRQRDQ